MILASSLFREAGTNFAAHYDRRNSFTEKPRIFLDGLAWYCTRRRESRARAYSAALGRHKNTPAAIGHGHSGPVPQELGGSTAIQRAGPTGLKSMLGELVCHREQQPPIRARHLLE